MHHSKTGIGGIKNSLGLYTLVKSNLPNREIRFTAYTDSQVVLAWVRNDKAIDKKFVEKRIKFIKSTILPSQLHYIPSKQNPADPASRGLTAEQLSSCDLWFRGPQCLQDPILPFTPFLDQKESLNFTLVNPPTEEDMFLRFSNWSTILKVVAYCRRWKHSSETKFINANEYKKARYAVVKYYQSLYLGEVL